MVLIIGLILVVPTISGLDSLNKEGTKKVTCTGNADFDILSGEDLENVNCFVEDRCGLLFATAPLSLFGSLIGEDLKVVLEAGAKTTSKTFTNVGPLEAPEFKLSLCVPDSQKTAALKLYKESGALSDSKGISI